MNDAQRHLAALSDERLPALPAMLGDGAREMLDAAFAATGGRVVSARPVQVTWHPGRSLTVTYAARAGWHGERVDDQTIVAVTGGAIPAGATVLASGDQRVAVWRMQDDPELPGLAAALDPERARTLLDQLDVAPGRVRTRLRAYRPRRRAVVEVTTKQARLFIKAVPPREVAALQARHQLMSAHLPVPISHGWSHEAGLVVLRAMDGATLRTTFADPRAALPSAAQLAQVLDRIPDSGDDRRPHAPLDGAAGYGELVARIVPALRPRVDALLAAVAEAARGDTMVPVHGDFHEAQLLINRGAVSGVLDLDTAGIGERADDWATLIGHLSTLEASSQPRAAARVRTFGREALAVAEQDVSDHAGLRLRIAAVVTGMATGPFRVQTPAWPQETAARIAIAERWVESARNVSRERSLMAAS